MMIWLKDFPQNIQEYRALIAHGHVLHNVSLIEELFIKDEEEEQTSLTHSSSDPAILLMQEELLKAK